MHMHVTASERWLEKEDSAWDRAGKKMIGWKQELEEWNRPASLGAAIKVINTSPLHRLENRHRTVTSTQTGRPRTALQPRQG